MSEEKKEQKDLTGALFKNLKKETESHPDYNGKIMVDGKLFWIAGWMKKSKTDLVYMSLALTKVEDQQQKTDETITPDDLPF